METMNQLIMAGIANDLRNELIKVCPRNTSHLATSITVIPTQRGVKIAMLEYGKYVEFGTNPHIIEAKSKKALAFKDGGKTVIVKKVHHPGTRPNPFIRTTIHTKLKAIIMRNIKKHS